MPGVAPSKSSTTLLASQTIPAGGSVNSGWVNVGSVFELEGMLSVSLPGPAPSAGPTITWDRSPDNGATVYNSATQTGTTAVQSYFHQYGDTSLYVRLTVKNNDAGGNSIGVVAHLGRLDNVG